MISILHQHKGIYHLCGKGYMDRFTWASAILDLIPSANSPLPVRLLPAKTIEFPTPAKRPLFSALDCSLVESTFDLVIPEWLDTLKLALTNS